MEKRIEVSGGFVELVDYMPSNLIDAERRIVEAARTSTGKERRNTKLETSDKGLIKFLWRNEHMTPFEMCVLQFVVKCPIFVARQWMRHRTGSFNEQSGRYSVMKDEFYEPEHVRMQHKVHKQMSDPDAVIDEDVSADFYAYLEQAEALYEKYQELVNRGVAKELARIGLPVSAYTQFMWTVNLRNLMHFLELRTAEDAQPEIRDFANAIYQIIKPIFPITCEAFEDSSNSTDFTARELVFINEHYNITIEPKDSAPNNTMRLEVERKLKMLIGTVRIDPDRTDA